MKDRSPIVHVVDDDAQFLAAIARMLRASQLEVSVFSSAAEFFKLRDPTASGCVLADLRMPGMNGLELQAALAQTSSPLPVLILTGDGDIPSTVLAMRQGAEDFLEKLAPRETLLAAIRRALLRDALERNERQRRHHLCRLFDTLSPREREVLDLVVQGNLNKEIAAILGIHERTVKLHRTAITTKLRVPSVAGLTQMVIQLRGAPRLMDQRLLQSGSGHLP